MSLSLALFCIATFAPPATAITHVTVIDGTGAAAKADQTILIEGDHIQSVGASSTTKVSASTKVIDGTGKFVMPGLWDIFESGDTIHY